MSRADTLMSRHTAIRNRMWGQSVTYARQSSGATIDLTARKAGVRTVDQSGGDILVHSEWFDWVVAAADLVDDGSTFEPSERDTITVDSMTYQVGCYGDDKPWSPADSEKRELVVHTKLWSES